MKIKLKIGQVVTNQFATAFGTLCAEISLPVKERYALGRVMRDIRTNMELYEEQRVNLVKKLGAPQTELTKRQIDSAKVKADDALVNKLKEQLARQELNPGWEIDPSDKDTLTKFDEEITKLRSYEFEIFLDHKVKLTDAVKLNAKDLEALDSIVEVEA